MLAAAKKTEPKDMSGPPRERGSIACGILPAKRMQNVIGSISIMGPPRKQAQGRKRVLAGHDRSFSTDRSDDKHFLICTSINARALLWNDNTYKQTRNS
jgi:hypothetical protein